MIFQALPIAFGLSVRSALKPKGFEDADGHCLPLEKRTDADADGPEEAPMGMYPFHIPMFQPNPSGGVDQRT
jgi:hypothetical protein